MKPSQTATALRQIADRIDRSSSPNRQIVASDLQKVLHHIAEQETVSLFGIGDKKKEKKRDIDWKRVKSFVEPSKKMLDQANQAAEDQDEKELCNRIKALMGSLQSMTEEWGEDLLEI